MFIAYSLIIILAFSIFGLLIMNNYKDMRIKNVRVRLFQTANIVADTYKANMEDIVSAKFMVKSYGQQSDSRILIIDIDGNVLIDNHNTFVGQTLDNHEIREGLGGRSSSSIYTMNGEEVLHISVPITKTDGLETRIIGAVLISSSMSSLNQDIGELRDGMFKIAISALIVSLALAAILANRITEPLRILSHGVARLSSGDLGFSIEKGGEDEIGQLIQSFNDMSHKLHSIEHNRKVFINSISHELRTPLTSIRALIDSLLIDDSPPSVYREYMKDIYGETERMEGLVHYLTTSIKLEDIVLDLKTHDINEILQDAIDFMNPYAKKMGVEIQFAGTGPSMVECDRSRIKEVLFNLIDNSIKYRDARETNSYVLVESKALEDHILIDIEDNGLGIDKDDIPNIFEGGFRVLDRTILKTDGVKGYGIGLAIVKNILDKHNWAISVESSLGLGSRFTITIPI